MSEPVDISSSIMILSPGAISSVTLPKEEQILVTELEKTSRLRNEDIISLSSPTQVSETKYNGGDIINQEIHDTRDETLDLEEMIETSEKIYEPREESSSHESFEFNAKYEKSSSIISSIASTQGEENKQTVTSSLIVSNEDITSSPIPERTSDVILLDAVNENFHVYHDLEKNKETLEQIFENLDESNIHEAFQKSSSVLSSICSSQDEENKPTSTSSTETAIVTNEDSTSSPSHFGDAVLLNDVNHLEANNDDDIDGKSDDEKSCDNLQQDTKIKSHKEVPIEHIIESSESGDEYTKDLLESEMENDSEQNEIIEQSPEKDDIHSSDL